MPRRLLQRSTLDVVILTLTATVCIIMLSGFVYVGIATFYRPGIERETYRIAEGLIQLLDVIVGGLVGFIAGRFIKTPPKSEDGDAPKPP